MSGFTALFAHRRAFANARPGSGHARPRGSWTKDTTSSERPPPFSDVRYALPTSPQEGVFQWWGLDVVITPFAFRATSQLFPPFELTSRFLIFWYKFFPVGRTHFLQEMSYSSGLGQREWAGPRDGACRGSYPHRPLRPESPPGPDSANQYQGTARVDELTVSGFFAKRWNPKYFLFFRNSMKSVDTTESACT